MSKGPGRIERAIEAIFDAEQDNAFSTDDLCWRIYPGINSVEKKHRVAVTRAAWNVWRRRDAVACWRSDGLGGMSIWYDQTRVLSYAMARLKAFNYCGNDPRIHWRYSESDLRKKMEPGDRYHEYIAPGGAWWTHTESNTAEIEARRTGDEQRLNDVLTEREQRNQAIKRILRIS